MKIRAKIQDQQMVAKIDKLYVKDYKIIGYNIILV